MMTYQELPGQESNQVTTWESNTVAAPVIVAVDVITTIIYGMLA